MNKPFTEEELEDRINELEEQVKVEKEEWARDNLKTNLNHFRKLLHYYQEGFKEGYKRVLTELNTDEWVEELNKLTDKERLEIFKEFCCACGDANPNCQCRNDE